MKKALVFVLTIFVASFSSCSILKKNPQKEMVTLSGTVQEMGMTTFQYGTHKIKAGEKTYALKSDMVKLADYADKAVTLKGRKVAGYPLEGGPELIEVSTITLK